MPDNNTPYRFIVCFVDEGFTNLVMEAAKKEGARGGTIAHARGTGTKEIEEKYGITITENKEMVMIIVPTEICDKVLKGINDAAGMQSPGKGIAFSLPVETVLGLGPENQEPKQKEEK
jgi:nitrogen regulatory protein PII